MKIKVSKSIHFSSQIQFLFKEQATGIPDFMAEAGEIGVRYSEQNTIIYGGMGERDSVSTAIIRNVSAKAIQKAIELKRDRISVVLPSPDALAESGKAIIEGIILGSYKFDKYRSEKAHQVGTVELIGNISSTDVRKLAIVCETVNYSRDLVNENASVLTPERFAKEAGELEKFKNVKVTVLGPKELEREGLGLISAVGQGSSTPPRLIIIEYNGSNRKTRTALVGKGITFDSGGQNLKPTGSIETMREDMAGAAVVLGVMKALASLQSSVNVIGVIAAAHNAIGNKSFFPGDIYRSYSGKTVEIHSTDAEGRLILADAVSYCQAIYKPSELIDLATLTGAILTTFGEYVSGLFSNNDELAQRLFESGETTNERLWRLPLYKEYSDSLKGELGDLRNLSRFKKGYASSIIGAAFVQEFINDIPWAHLDIAGTSFNNGSSRGEIPQYGTGFGVRLLLEFLLNK
ncbi:MAG: leucyl aminopeptidase family protein [Fibrobacter sp.]|jgi:leucyl aminopeptidase|nr:leucyl aminopeptidase family protein [Fibrobacter sp.]